MTILSESFFPVDMMPEFMRPIMTIVSPNYLGNTLRQIMVETMPRYQHYINLAAVGGQSLVCLVGAVQFFRWE